METAFGYQVVAAGVERAGIRTMFGVAGNGSLEIAADFAGRTGCSYVAARHEAAAINMADGYARRGGGMAAVVVTQGPGLTNGVTALATAARHHSPLLVFTGTVPRTSSQWFDQATLADATGVGFADLDGERNWGHAVTLAAAEAASTRRPVVVQVPTSQQRSAFPLGWPRPAGATAAAIPPDDGDVAGAADLLGRSTCPVVLAGRGAVVDSAREPMERLADRVGALLATTLPAKGLFDGSPFDLGIAGSLATPGVRRLLRRADCVVAVGTSLDRRCVGDDASLIPDATVIHCDHAREVLGNGFPGRRVPVHGSASRTVRALLDALPGEPVEPVDGFRNPEVVGELTTLRGTPRFDAVEGDGLDPRVVMCHLDEALPVQRTVVVDGGHFCGFPAMYLRASAPTDFLFTLGFGAIGMAVGTAVGASIAAPGRCTVAIVGDGGLMMSLGDLDTAARYRLPLIVVVLNDNAYGAEVHALRHAGLPSGIAEFDNPSFTGLARALGLSAGRAADLDEIGRLVADAVHRRTPYLIEVPINGDVLASWYAEDIGLAPIG
ncbi:thiamine pyrophosphate-binding protein [Actinophytocola sp.]|uniref:thiamine pyrophosphate-binding protein n=1 Tax=Actinophytocola sp. TaxID=1872138 RepID=UPI003D6BFD36